MYATPSEYWLGLETPKERRHLTVNVASPAIRADEVNKFCSLLKDGDTTVIEALYVDGIYESDAWKELKTWRRELARTKQVYSKVSSLGPPHPTYAPAVYWPAPPHADRERRHLTAASCQLRGGVSVADGGRAAREGARQISSFSADLMSCRAANPVPCGPTQVQLTMKSSRSCTREPRVRLRRCAHERARCSPRCRVSSPRRSPRMRPRYRLGWLGSERVFCLFGSRDDSHRCNYTQFLSRTVTLLGVIDCMCTPTHPSVTSSFPPRSVEAA